MSGTYHGVSIRDAAMLVGVPEATVRKWLQRGNIQRSTDGQVDPFALQEWWDYKRSPRANRGNQCAARDNPYKIQEAS